MWLKFLLLFLLFGFLGILQNSFLAQFNAVNLIFILFFLVIFFFNQWEDILFSAVIAGFFLDIFSSSYFGVVTVFLLIIAFISKKILALLKVKRDKYPIIYFISLFVLSFLVFNLLQLTFHFDRIFLREMLYNLFFAVLGYYIYRKFNPYEFSKKI